MGTNNQVRSGDIQGIEQFLKDYTGMSIAPSRNSETVLKGIFSFTARRNGGVEITDSYHLRIIVPSTFPKDIPKVTELERKIPRDGKHHINQDDNTLCLGSPIRLLKLMSEKPDLVGFAERCIVPYLYAISCKLRNNDGFPFGELKHGSQGIVDDYSDIFGLKTREHIVEAIRMLGLKRRIANKLPCPCGCGKRLGKCAFNKLISKYRALASRSWFKNHLRNI